MRSHDRACKPFRRRGGKQQQRQSLGLGLHTPALVSCPSSCLRPSYCRATRAGSDQHPLSILSAALRQSKYGASRESVSLTAVGACMPPAIQVSHGNCAPLPPQHQRPHVTLDFMHHQAEVGNIHFKYFYLLLTPSYSAACAACCTTPAPPRPQPPPGLLPQ